ncbi:MAG: zeta toxin family protein [Rhodanobacteraceae bacterium]
MTVKRIIIIAGPNGAGKTTFANEFLPNEANCPMFINADLIAAGLSPFKPELAAIKAGKLMLQSMTEFLARSESFAFETTLAGTQYARRIPHWRKAGYHVTLIFLSLAGPEMAIARVVERVRQGGHAIPEDVIRRRFAAGRKNFQRLYQGVVDDWAEYDNSGPQPRLIDWKGES